MKRYLILLLVFVFAVGAVNASSGFDDALNSLESYVDFDVTYFVNDTNVTVGDNNFTIPKGFGEIEQLAVEVSKKNDSESVKFFTNADNEVLMISTTSSEDINETIYDYIPEDIPYENATIKGHDGLKWSEESYAFFSYLENNEIVVIQAPNESYFEGMIN